MRNMARTKNKNHAAIIRQSVADLVDESERHRKDAGQLRLAGLTLIKYLERLAAGKTIGIIQGNEVQNAVRVIRDTQA